MSARPGAVGLGGTPQAGVRGRCPALFSQRGRRIVAVHMRPQTLRPLLDRLGRGVRAPSVTRRCRTPHYSKKAAISRRKGFFLKGVVLGSRRRLSSAPAVNPGAFQVADRRPAKSCGTLPASPARRHALSHGVRNEMIRPTPVRPPGKTHGSRARVRGRRCALVDVAAGRRVVETSRTGTYCRRRSSWCRVRTR